MKCYDHSKAFFIEIHLKIYLDDEENSIQKNLEYNMFYEHFRVKIIFLWNWALGRLQILHKASNRLFLLRRLPL